MSQKDRVEIGLSGKRLVKDFFSWHKIAQEMASVYKWILFKEKKPQCVIS